MMASKKKLQQQTPKSRPNKKCFNYSKKNYYTHYTRDCPSRIYLKRNPKVKKTEQEAKYTR